MQTRILYRPVGPGELELIKKSGWKKFPPRLPEQPIFYPVLNEEYANQINIEWNVPAYGTGFTMKFHINADYFEKFEVRNVGGQNHNELWVPSEKMDEFNSNIVGLIDIVKKFNKD